VTAAIAVIAPVPATASSTRRICHLWQALHVTGSGAQPYVVMNKPSINHNDRGMCLSVPGQGAAFTVTHSPGAAPSPKVRAYPYIGTGCFKGVCASAHPGRLLRAGSLGNYTVSWATATPPHSGVWNSSLEAWLGPRSGIGKYEVMIWLHYSGPMWWPGRYPEESIDGAKWYVVPHTTPVGRHYISFRRATPVAAATLRLAPFMAAAERVGAVTASARLWAVQAGFEIWSGGQGLRITRFSVTK
jgi:cellulose 1,4-beta-cellobiosidase